MTDYKKTKRRLFFKKSAVWVLILTITTILFNGFRSFADENVETIVREAKDITSLVTFSLDSLKVKKDSVYKDVIVNGAPVTDNLPTITQEDSVKIEYKWEINEANILKVNKDDFFIIQLPDKNIIKSKIVTADITIGDKVLGTFKVDKEGVLTATLNGKDFSKNGAITSGILGVSAEINSTVKEISLSELVSGESSSTIKINVEEKPKTPGNGGTGGVTPGVHHPEYFKTTENVYRAIYKYGSFRPYTDAYPYNYISYAITVNGEEFEKIYKANISNTHTVKPKNNVLVTDTLPDGLEIDPDFISVISPFFAPSYKNGVITEDGSSGHYVFNGDSTNPKGTGLNRNIYINHNNNTEAFFQVIESGDENDLVSFEDQISSATTPTIGIWKKKKLIVKIPTLPDTRFKFEDYFGGEENFKKKLEHFLTKETQKDRILSQEQVDRMLKSYLGKPLLGYRIAIRARIVGSAKTSYENTVYISYDNSIKTSHKINTSTELAWGSAKQEPFTGDITVKKSWKGAVKDSITINILDENKNIVKTHDLIYPKTEYTFTGLEKFHTDGRERKYTVSEVSIDGYRSEIEKDQTKWIFYITNYEQRDFKVKKKWFDADDKEITDTSKLPTETKIFVYKVVDGDKIKIEGKEHSFKASESWIHTFSGLDKIGNDENEVKYIAVEEVVPEGFEVSEGETEGEYFVLVNKQKKVEGSPSDPSKTEPKPPTTSIVVPPVFVEPIPPIPPVIPSTELPGISSDSPIGKIEYPDPKSPVLPIIPTVDEEGNIDIDIDGDNIPLGDSEIEDDEEYEEEDLDIVDDNSPRGNTNIKKNKKLLAKTGGIQSSFNSILLIFSILLLLLLSIESYRRAEEN